MYVWSEDWIKHMKDHHATREWICPFCNQSFGNVAEFYLHIRSIQDHAEETAGSQLPILAELSLHQMPLDLRICPLCSYSDNQEFGYQSLLDHISEYTLTFALISIPWEEGFGGSEMSIA